MNDKQERALRHAMRICKIKRDMLMVLDRLKFATEIQRRELKKLNDMIGRAEKMLGER